MYSLLFHPKTRSSIYMWGGSSTPSQVTQLNSQVVYKWPFFPIKTMLRLSGLPPFLLFLKIVSLSYPGLTAWSDPAKWRRSTRSSPTRQWTAFGPYVPRLTTRCIPSLAMNRYSQINRVVCSSERNTFAWYMLKLTIWLDCHTCAMEKITLSGHIRCL